MNLLRHNKSVHLEWASWSPKTILTLSCCGVPVARAALVGAVFCRSAISPSKSSSSFLLTYPYSVFCGLFYEYNSSNVPNCFSASHLPLHFLFSSPAFPPFPPPCSWYHHQAGKKLLYSFNCNFIVNSKTVSLLNNATMLSIYLFDRLSCTEEASKKRKALVRIHFHSVCCNTHFGHRRLKCTTSTVARSAVFPLNRATFEVLRRVEFFADYWRRTTE